MRVAFLAGATVLLLSFPAAQDQATTADGIDAFFREDYGRAAEILTEAAETPAGPDETAAFLLATMYEDGRGVPADPVRACVYYSRAVGGAFSGPAVALAQQLGHSLTPQQKQDCAFFAGVGFYGAFEPVTFILEPGQWISLDVRRATITYDGKQRAIDLNLAAHGVRFLPVRHAELATGPQRTNRRHFIEIFRYTRTGEEKWTLQWTVYEVVRDQLVNIVSEGVGTVSSDPSKDRNFDPSAYARLAVNENGDAEWTIRGSSPQRTGLIVTDAERQEAKRRTQARADADARVDWKRTLDINRAPSLAYGDSDGCGFIYLYGWSSDRAEAITVRADKDVLQLSTTPRTFDLAVQQASLEVLAHVFERPVRNWPFCTDVIDGGLQKQVWRARRGTVTIALGPARVPTNVPGRERATIRIVDAEFVDPSGRTVKQIQPIVLTGIVGWLAGG